MSPMISSHSSKKLHQQEVLGSEYIQADEIRIPVRDPVKAKLGQEPSWLYWAPTPLLVFVDYQPGDHKMVH